MLVIHAFDRSKPAILKIRVTIRVAVGDPPVILSPSDSILKRSGVLDKCASFDVHDILRPVVHAISMQPERKTLLRLKNKI